MKSVRLQLLVTLAAVATVVAVFAVKGLPPSRPLYDCLFPPDYAQLRRHGGWGTRDEEGLTALHEAAVYGLKDAVVVLLSSGADVNAETDFGMTALGFAAIAPDGHVAETREDDCDVTDERIVELLLERGAHVDGGSDEDWPPLHLAAHRGHIRMVARLLAKGARVDRRDSWGRTPLTHAIEAGHKELVSLLRRHGARE